MTAPVSAPAYVAVDWGPSSFRLWLIGTDGGNFALPGPGVHHEMQVFAEDMGLPPMQIIQAATRWPAECRRSPKAAASPAATERTEPGRLGRCRRRTDPITSGACFARRS